MPTLLDSDFLRKLSVLSILARRIFAGTGKGEKRSHRRGTSVEFADYRDYTVGDDLRYVDWNIYGRLEKLFVKLFVEEEDLQVNLLIDTSRSMSFGEPPKLDYAAKVAAALGYIALAGFDRLAACSFSDQLVPFFKPVRGRGYIFQLFEDLEKLQADGQTQFDTAMRRFVELVRRPGVVIVISDFLFRDGFESGLKMLLGRGFEVGLVQVLDRTEVEPDLVGDLKLIDCETNAVKEVTISDSLLRAYRRALQSHCEAIRSFCMRRGISYVRTVTDVPFEDLILKELRAAGMVK